MAALSLLALLAQAIAQPEGGQAATAGAAVEAAPQTAAERADAVTRWRPYSLEASRRFGVPLEWIERVMRAESGGRTHLRGRPITSRAGAMGLMQVMPGTWAEVRARLGLGSDPHDPRDNILAGTYYLRLMHDRFGYPGLFGAYNAGPGRYAEWLSGRRALPAETTAYLAQVGGPAASSRAATSQGEPRRPPTLFAVRRDAPEPASGAEATPEPSLFVRLSTAARPERVVD
jgi:soluble lytic murein transglycosylase-like protein